MNQNDIPAILGGMPIRPQGPPVWPQPDADIEEAVRVSFQKGTWGHYHGPNVEALEAKLNERYCVPRSFAVASGTLAMEIALRSLGVGPDTEVVMAGYEYEATFLTIHALGALPVLVDVNPRNGTIEPSQLDGAFTSKTRAVIATHLHGGLADLPAIWQKAQRQKVGLIQDLSQSPGLQKLHPADFHVLSFGGSKPLTSGRGGALLCSTTETGQRAKLHLERGTQQWARLSELQATVLLPQLDKLDGQASQRRRSVSLLQSLIADVPGLQPFENPSDAGETDYYKVGFWFHARKFSLSRELFVRSLRAEGIAFSPGFRALHVGRSPSRFRAVGTLPQAKIAHDTVVTLHHPVLLAGDSAIEEVACALRKTYRNAERIAAAELPPTNQLRFDD